MPKKEDDGDDSDSDDKEVPNLDDLKKDEEIKESK